MEVQGSYTFDAPQDEVFAAVQDPEVLSKTLPGVQELKLTGENEYWASMKIRIGPVQGVFTGTVKLSDMNPPTGFHLSVNGKGAPGFVQGEGDLVFKPNGEVTVMEYSGDAQVGGRLASVGQRLIESSTKALIDQSLESLDSIIEARSQGEEIGEIAAPQAPSELAFAAGVTRKMVEDLVPVEKRQEYLQTGVFALILLAAFWLISNWWINRFADRVAEKMKEAS